MRKYLAAIILGVVVGLGLASYLTYEYLFDDDDAQCRTWEEILTSDTLRVVTVPTSISAFQYEGNWRGHEYEVARQVAKSLDLKLQIIYAPDEQSVLDSIRTGAADVAAWPVFYSISEADGHVLRCGYRYELGLVPVANNSVNLQTTDTAVYSLAVVRGRRPWMALQDTAVTNSFDMTPFRLEVIDEDTIPVETLAERVIAGQYDVTVLPTNMAQLLRTYHDDMQVGMPMVMSEDSVSWVVSIKADTLAQKIDSILCFDRTTPHYAPILKRYFEKSLGNNVKIHYLLGGGKLSVYDDIFRKYSTNIGWDWRMLAAVAYTESRFDPHDVSSKGARGLMQLMPATAENYGCPLLMMTEPEANVAAGSRLIESLENSLRSRISRTKEPSIEKYKEASDATREAIERDLVFFTLAGYNAGLGHVFDAIALADTLGYDPAVWKGNVEYCLTLKNDEAYYTLPCVRLGKFNPDVTINYVQEVLDVYGDFCRRVKK